MPIKPDAPNQKEFKLVPEGTHMARCYQIIHYGHVPNTFPGAENPWINKIRLVFELPDELEVFKEGEEPRPYSIGIDYTLSMHAKSKLRPMLDAWLGKKMSDEEANDFDIELLLGKPCFITVGHKENEIAGRTYASILSITKPPNKTEVLPAVNQAKIISWTTLTPESFEKLPVFLQDKLKTAQEYKLWLKNKSGNDPLSEVPYPQNEETEEIPF